MQKHSRRPSRPQRDKSRTLEAKRATMERRANRAEKWFAARAALKAMGGE